MKGAERRVQGGFTLVELMVGSTLAAVVMAAVLSSFVFLGRNLTRMANYQSLESKGREAMTWLRRDLALAGGVKPGTVPTAASLTLVLPAGEVTYAYDSATGRLLRTADFGANPSISLLKTDLSTCTAFAFEYFTISGGSPASQVSPNENVPYSIKQIQVRFTVETPPGVSAMARTQYSAVSARHAVRNRQFPDGT